MNIKKQIIPFILICIFSIYVAIFGKAEMNVQAKTWPISTFVGKKEFDLGRDNIYEDKRRIKGYIHWKIPSNIIDECEKNYGEMREGDYKIHINIFKYNGKHVTSKELSLNTRHRHEKGYNGINSFIALKYSKKTNAVYYCKIRLCYKNHPISSWSKPVYAWAISKKVFFKRIKLIGITKNKVKKFNIKMPKVKGIKKYKIFITPDVIDTLIHYKKTVKSGKTAVLRNLKCDYDSGYNQKKLVATFSVYIDPVFSKKGDEIYLNSGDDVYLRAMVRKK